MRTVAIVFLCLLLSTSRAEEGASDFSPHIDDLKTTKEVLVVLMPMYMSGPVGLTEESTRRRGCAYATSDRAYITNLVGILANMQIPGHIERAWKQEPRELIYLTLSTGEQVKFLLGAKFSNQADVRGVFVRASAEIPVSAGLSLPNDLYQWVAKIGVPVEVNAINKMACDFFSNKLQEFKDR